MRMRTLPVEKLNLETGEWEQIGTARVPQYLVMTDEEALRDIESYLTKRQRVLERPYYNQARYRNERVVVMRMRDRLNAILNARAA
jgi:hypothetical protein